MKAGKSKILKSAIKTAIQSQISNMISSDGASISHQTTLANGDSLKTSIDIGSDQVAKRHTSEVHSNSMSIQNSFAALADDDLPEEDTNVTKNVFESCGYDSDLNKNEIKEY
nr:hypothetical protein [Tanacetum cinerariifolium]